jgi:hypothetical protein
MRPDAAAGGSKVLRHQEEFQSGFSSRSQTEMALWGSDLVPQILPLVARLAKSMISPKAVADLTALLCAAPDFLT